MPAERLAVAGRSPQHLRPVRRQVLEVIRVQSMGEGVVQLRVLEAALVGGGCQRDERLVTTGKLVEGWPGHLRMVTLPPRSRKAPSAAAAVLIALSSRWRNGASGRISTWTTFGVSVRLQAPRTRPPMVTMFDSMPPIGVASR